MLTQNYHQKGDIYQRSIQQMQQQKQKNRELGEELFSKTYTFRPVTNRLSQTLQPEAEAKRTERLYELSHTLNAKKRE